MAVSLSLDDDALAQLDDWADDHGFNRTEAVEVMTNIVAGGMEVSFAGPSDSSSTTESTTSSTSQDDSGLEEDDAPSTEDIKSISEARSAWQAAKQTADARIPILGQIVQSEAGTYTEDEMQEVIEDVTLCSRGYWTNYADKLVAREHMMDSPLLRREWVSDADVRDFCNELSDDGPTKYNHLSANVQSRDDLLDYLDVPGDTNLWFASSMPEAAVWRQAAEALADAGRKDRVTQWACERLVEAAVDAGHRDAVAEVFGDD